MREPARKSTLNSRVGPHAIDQRDRVVIQHRRASLGRRRHHHCQIGAVTAVALASLGCKHVQWSMLGKILVSWILTIPTSAVIAAIILWIFRPAVCASCPWS